MSDFVHLHVHSHYSVLDGFGKPEDIVKRAKDIGSRAVAITDHGSINSMVALFSACKTHEIKPIIGVEFYVVDNVDPDKDEKRYHLCVWAKNWDGVKSIMSLLTIANEQFYRRPRISIQQALTFKDCCISTACSFGILAHPAISNILPLFVKKYGGDFYLEMMPINFEEQAVINKKILALHDKYPFNIIATNDAHYVNKEDARVHDALLAIQTNSLISSTSRFKFDSDEYYLKTRSEMFDAFVNNHPYIPADIVNKALDTTGILADKCNVTIPEFPITLPTPYDEDDEVVFSRIIKDGWIERESIIEKFGKHSKDDYIKRLMFEIDVIKTKGFVRYFLVVCDAIKWAKDNGIMVGPARGSAAGSLVCWLMGITQVDPLRWGLYFERFLDIEREDYPDIDVDFQDDKRHLVFEYIRNKYGHDKTAQIATFGFLKAKSAFRDMCRVHGKEMFLINDLSKKIDDESSFEEVPEVLAFSKKYPDIVNMAKSVCGTIRSQGCHAAGIVVSSRPLTDVCVVERRSGSDVCNWDKRDCESFGLIKIDVLGLSTLSVLSRAKDLILKNRGVNVVFEEIDFEDERVLNLFKTGETVGIFQFEGREIRKLLVNVNPKDFNQVTDCTALYRPGSLESGQTEKYVSIAKGHDYESYVFEGLRPILKNTMGQIVYQEQIMQIFNQIGGFTWAEANKMRKIIGKKLGPEEFEKHRDHFVSGAVANGVASHHADKLFTDMVSFASYSFNLSHAISYTMISWWCAYLKVYYPLEYFAAVLDCSTKANLIPNYIHECEKLGVNLRLPDINKSSKNYETDIESNCIIAPLGVIKNVGGKAVDEILRARSDGPFLSLKNFQERVAKRTCNSRVVDSLLRAGCFESLGSGTADQEQREKDLSELLQIFQKVPGIALEKDEEFEMSNLKELFSDISRCPSEVASEVSGKIMMPYLGGKKASVFVLNAPQKNEDAVLSKDGTKYLIKILASAEITTKSIYYSAPYKCYHKGGDKPSKECYSKCVDYLKREIEIVKPKLILCMATDYIKLFTKEKPSMKDLHGSVSYCKEYDAYVLFSYSPQYLYYGDDKKPLVDSLIGSLRQLFHGEEVIVDED